MLKKEEKEEKKNQIYRRTWLVSQQIQLGCLILHCVNAPSPTKGNSNSYLCQMGA